MTAMGSKCEELESSISGQLLPSKAVISADMPGWSRCAMPDIPERSFCSITKRAFQGAFPDKAGFLVDQNGDWRRGFANRKQTAARRFTDRAIGRSCFQSGKLHWEAVTTRYAACPKQSTLFNGQKYIGTFGWALSQPIVVARPSSYGVLRRPGRRARSFVPSSSTGASHR
jgi:hypothetical protein